jgi:hypothetical protein
MSTMHARGSTWEHLEPLESRNGASLSKSRDPFQTENCLFNRSYYKCNICNITEAVCTYFHASRHLHERSDAKSLCHCLPHAKLCATNRELCTTNGVGRHGRLHKQCRGREVAVANATALGPGALDRLIGDDLADALAKVVLLCRIDKRVAVSVSHHDHEALLFGKPLRCLQCAPPANLSGTRLRCDGVDDGRCGCVCCRLHGWLCCGDRKGLKAWQCRRRLCLCRAIRQRR